MQELNEFITCAEIQNNKLIFNYTKQLLQLTRRYYNLKLKTKRLQVKYIKKFVLMCLTNYMDKYA